MKVSRLLKEGYTGYHTGREFRIVRGNQRIESLSDSQSRILEQLMDRKAMTPKQLSEVVGTTPAAVIYNLKPLVRAGILDRQELPGGTVLYVLCWKVKIGLSPSLREKIESKLSKPGWLNEMKRKPFGELRKELDMLTGEEFLDFMRFLADDTT